MLTDDKWARWYRHRASFVMRPLQVDQTQRNELKTLREQGLGRAYRSTYTIMQSKIVFKFLSGRSAAGKSRSHWWYFRFRQQLAHLDGMLGSFFFGSRSEGKQSETMALDSWPLHILINETVSGKGNDQATLGHFPGYVEVSGEGNPRRHFSSGSKPNTQKRSAARRLMPATRRSTRGRPRAP